MENASPSSPGALPVLFSTGQIVATPGALGLLEQHGILPIILIERHIRGDWGIVSFEDAAANNDAVKYGNRILSSYPVGDCDRVWIITEWGRSVSTLLMPSEY